MGGTCIVTANQWRSPVSGLVTADLLDNTGDDGGYRFVSTGNIGNVAGRIFTFSVWIRADYDHVVGLHMESDAGGVAANDSIYVTGTWQRYSISGIVPVGAGTEVYVMALPGEDGVAVGQAYFSDAQLIENDEYRTGMGSYLNPADQTITKPTHDLAPSGTPPPTRALSDTEYQGNRLPSRHFSGYSEGQYYSKAHHDSMNVFEGDHTLTIVFSCDTDGTNAPVLFDHSGWDIGGIVVYYASGSLGADYAGGDWPYVGAFVNLEDGTEHVLQLVRSDDTAELFLDGVSLDSVDVTGSGLDADYTLSIGDDSYGDTWEGRISFCKLTARAMSAVEVQAEARKVRGEV